MRGARPGAALDGEVRRTVRFGSGDTVVLACSGGPDSVALAAVLDRLARAGGFELVLGHVNHGLRQSAWQDECVVLAAGARLGRPVRTASLGPGPDDEATLRARRYEELTGIARVAGARAVVTAHTAEDQTESVLLALFRGTGLRGLAGMAPRRPLAPGVDLLRPLLRVPSARLASALRPAGLAYAIDPTNADPRYRRNALRARLAGLREDFPHLDAAVARCAEIVRAELSGDERAAERSALRSRLRERDLLDDIPFERIEAALAAGPRARVHLKRGVHSVGGKIVGPGD